MKIKNPTPVAMKILDDWLTDENDSGPNYWLWCVVLLVGIMICSGVQCRLEVHSVPSEQAESSNAN